MEYVTGCKDCIINYLDDFLFLATSKEECDFLVKEFLVLCKRLGVLVAEEKTEWGDTRVIFLGILIEGEFHVLSIPEEKRTRAVNMLKVFVAKRKATIKDLQRLSGYLNFLTRAIFPGRTFTHRMYAKFHQVSATLKPYHHIKLDEEFKDDCRMWLGFLQGEDQIANKAVC